MGIVPGMAMLLVLDRLRGRAPREFNFGGFPMRPVWGRGAWRGYEGHWLDRSVYFFGRRDGLKLIAVPVQVGAPSEMTPRRASREEPFANHVTFLPALDDDEIAAVEARAGDLFVSAFLALRLYGGVYWWTPGHLKTWRTWLDDGRAASYVVFRPNREEKCIGHVAPYLVDIARRLEATENEVAARRPAEE
jgi:hypothetical protein